MLVLWAHHIEYTPKIHYESCPAQVGRIMFYRIHQEYVYLSDIGVIVEFFPLLLHVLLQFARHIQLLTKPNHMSDRICHAHLTNGGFIRKVYDNRYISWQSHIPNLLLD